MKLDGMSGPACWRVNRIGQRMGLSPVPPAERLILRVSAAEVATP